MMMDGSEKLRRCRRKRPVKRFRRERRVRRTAGSALSRKKKPRPGGIRSFEGRVAGRRGQN
ncbi:hypothetical protein CE91St47_35800 [Eubacteriales bacterium]|nr:hypothetical protein CE91St47_35800 [Eubacteriales bacterium]